MADETRMKIRDLERASGVPRSTIHYYVREGLLHPPYRTGRTMAYYDGSHLRRLEAIQGIKMDYLVTRKSSRVPIDLIRHQLQEGYSLSRRKSPKRQEPRRKDNEHRLRMKREIIEAALGLYANRGFYLTNVRDIAKAVGISPPTFYHYFPDKRELFFEVIEYVIRGTRQEIEDALEDERNPLRRNLIMFRIFFENYPKIGEILNQLRAGLAINDEWARERLARVYRDLTDVLVREISEGIRQGRVREMDPDLLAFFLIANAEATIHRVSLDDRYSIEELAVFYDDFAKNGYLTEKGRKEIGTTSGRVRP